ncbi:MAG: flippase-like domain-containing protein [Saprospiraceae bacterium]|nr:flippase-like domain-containing protein [Saprospiraceae bacterium]
MKKNKLYSYLRFVVFLAFGAGLFYYVFHSQEEIYRTQCLQDPNHTGNCSLWSKLFEDIKQLDKILISMVMIGFVLSNVMRARRWVIMLKPLGITAGLWETFWAVHLGYFANLALPRMGELARAGSLARRLHAPLEKVLGTIISDRLIDLLVLVCFLIAGFLLQTQTLYHFLSTQADISVWSLMILSIVGLGSLVFIYFLFKSDRYYHPIIEKIKSKLGGLRDGIVSVLKSNKPIELTLLSLGIWLLYYAMTILGLKAFAPTAGVTLVQGLIVFIIGTLGMVVPTPGGIGPFHFLTMSALGIYGISSLDGFSYANLSFIIVQVITISFFGMIGMIFLSRTKTTSKQVETVL